MKLRNGFTELSWYYSKKSGIIYAGSQIPHWRKRGNNYVYLGQLNCNKKTWIVLKKESNKVILARPYYKGYKDYKEIVL